MKFSVKFEETNSAFTVNFGQIQNISDGGYERGYTTGYEDGKADATIDGLMLDSGNIKMSSDTATITIPHKLAAVPSAVYIWSNTKKTKSLFITGVALFYPTTSTYMTQAMGYNSSGATAALSGSNNVVNADKNEVTIKVHAAYPFKAGETYYWMVAQIKPLSEYKEG